MEQTLATSSINTTQQYTAITGVFTGAIRERFALHKQLGRSAAQIMLDALENVVRMGWLLSDLKREFKHVSGAYETHVTNTCEIGVRQADRYIEASKGFQRDALNMAESAELAAAGGITPDMFSIPHPVTLREQIKQENANSFADLLRKADLAKPKQLTGATERFDDKPLVFKISKALSMVQMRINRTLKGVDLATWSFREKQLLIDRLKPLVEFYDEVRSGVCSQEEMPV
jgi:hypothetical protein